ncbi:hypothetical protein ANN_01367 [Periplaneta americana]|uniref:Uncharacterized protein n=1 Tax=Periplaneta americana TaxID=6978 RepID=A0ABQ8TWD4_PERAM|nr:hypothetical protein ANN_01367 [Periplaneta americana]
MAGLCEGGNEPSGSLKAICKCSANDTSALYRYKTSANDKSTLYRYKTSANDKSALYRYKTASIDYSRICNRKRICEKSRRLEIQYCRRSRHLSLSLLGDGRRWRGVIFGLQYSVSRNQRQNHNASNHTPPLYSGVIFVVANTFRTVPESIQPPTKLKYLVFPLGTRTSRSECGVDHAMPF